MRCPRCQGEVEARAGACPRCGAPLRLREEPPVPALDRTLDLDRRSLPRGGPAAPAPLELEDTAPGPFGGVRRPRTTPAFWQAPGPSAESPGKQPTATGSGTADASAAGGGAASGGASGGPGGAEVAQLAASGAPGPHHLEDFELLDVEPEAQEQPAPEEPRTPPPIELHFTVASRGERLLSWAVDGLLAGALAWLLVSGGVHLAGGAETPPGAVATLAALLHFVHATVGSALAGRTLGKWMAGAEVVGPEGRHPSPGRAALRAALGLASAALVIPLLLALADRKGRAIHDRLLRTAVVRPP